jgi:hypothetical protein
VLSLAFLGLSQLSLQFPSNCRPRRAVGAFVLLPTSVPVSGPFFTRKLPFDSVLCPQLYFGACKHLPRPGEPYSVSTACLPVSALGYRGASRSNPCQPKSFCYSPLCSSITLFLRLLTARYLACPGLHLHLTAIDPSHVKWQSLHPPRLHLL